MKQLLLAFIIFCAQSVTAQKSASKVYVSSKAPVKINLPEDRELYGGTIINVTYKGSRFSNTIKGAFEYACKLVEENVPTTFPINISVEFSNLQDSECLAKVENYPLRESMAGRFPGSDNIYVKRYYQAYAADYPTFENLEEGNDFFMNSIDANIKFSSTQKFDYSIDISKISNNKYDFVTVAIQALLKAIGFTCNIYENDQKIYISSPSNQYTSKYFYTDNPSGNYSRATSGKFRFGKWSIVCDKPYKQGISMNYFIDSDDKETAILQYGISKGSYIRYIGKSLQSFFSDCDWDRGILTGSSSTTFNNAKTNNVISFKGIEVPTVYNIKNNAYLQDDNWNIFYNERREINPRGLSVLLKDGSWETFNDYTDLKENEKYARTVDGYLRLKKITAINTGLGYSNYKIEYQLYDYIPQKPEAGLNTYTLNTDEYLTNNSKRIINEEDDDEFVDVEIGLKNTEGTKEVIVEQTDSDYPIPYSYVIDSPQEGKFITLMNKKYPSLFKLTYINENGKTIGDEFTIDLTNNIEEQKTQLIELDIKNNTISYNVNNYKPQKLHYRIINITKGKTVINNDLTERKGTISLTELKNGYYSFVLYNNSSKIAERKIFIK